MNLDQKIIKAQVQYAKLLAKLKKVEAKIKELCSKAYKK